MSVYNMASFIHPVIGQVSGREGENCTQFLGVKYATLKDRFAEAELVRYYGSGIDATRFGPQVVSPEQAVDAEFGFIQQSLPKPESPGISEVDGLHLNITLPGGVDTITTRTQALLPVLVFIHGGGFGIGGNWWPQYDFARLVKLSTDLGKPLIGININYRVGALGFITSPELRAAGYKPNNGLRDQRMALRWIRENIAGFGGDPENITMMGQSAGAVSSGYMLLSEERLARRLICLGACPPLMGTVLPLHVSDQAAQGAMAMLGLQDTPPSEIVDRLLDLPVHDFFAKLGPAIPLLPTVDGDIIPRPFTFNSFAQETAQMSSRQWIESIFLVVSKLDASIMASMGLSSRKKGIAAAFRASAAESLRDHPEALASLLDQYSLSPAASPTPATDNGDEEDDAALMKVLTLISDVAFFLPAVNLAAQFPSDSFVGAFDEPNPWDGPFKGHASHVLDVAFLFQNFNDSLDPTQRGSAVALGTDVIAYVSGEKPWKAFNRGEKGGIGVYANGKRLYHHEQEAINGRRRVLLELVQNKKGPGLDTIARVVTDFMLK